MFFSSITADFNISSALRWAIQDQWAFCFCRYTGMPSVLRIFTSGVQDWKYRRLKKMSWNRENWERQKEEKMEKDKEIEDILWINWVLSAQFLRPESWRCRATLPGRYDSEVGSTVLLSLERKRSVCPLVYQRHGRAVSAPDLQSGSSDFK